MRLLSQSVTTVAIPIISLLSAPSLAMRKSARKLGNHGQGHGTPREEEVVKAVETVEVKVATEVVQVVQYPAVCMRRPRRAVTHTTERPAC